MSCLLLSEAAFLKVISISYPAAVSSRIPHSLLVCAFSIACWRRMRCINSLPYIVNTFLRLEARASSRCMYHLLSSRFVETVVCWTLLALYAQAGSRYSDESLYT